MALLRKRQRVIGGGASSVSAVINVYRTSGPAPHAVFFDAIGTTATGVSFPLDQLIYSWNFGDPGSGTFPFTGLSRNTQVGGPIAAHVYRTTGTKTVTLTVTDPVSGDFDTVQGTVTVTNPDTVWGGTDTICVSPTSNFTGAPAGAELRTTLPPSFDGKRVLLQRGATGFGNITLSSTVNNCMLGAFGTGAKPQMGSLTMGNNPPLAGRQFPEDIIVTDLELLNGIQTWVSGRRILFDSLKMDSIDPNANNEINLNEALDFYIDHASEGSNPPVTDIYNPVDYCINNCVIYGSEELNTIPDYNIVGIASRFAIMECDLWRAHQHSLRIFRSNRTFKAHNRMRALSADGIRTTIKHMSGGLAPYDAEASISGRFWATSYDVTANNLFGWASDNNQWMVVFAPQGPGDVQGLEDMVLENNVFTRGPNYVDDFVAAGRRITARGNTVNTGGPADCVSADNVYTGRPAEWQGPYFFS